MAENKNWSGTLLLNIESAKGLRNKDTFDASDPYVKVKVEVNGVEVFTAKTATVQNNLNPKWKANYMKCLSGSGPVRITLVVYDEDLVADEHLGTLVYEFVPPHKYRETVTKSLMSKKLQPRAKYGTITFNLSFVDDTISPRKLLKDEAFVIEGHPVKVVAGPVLHFRGTNPEENSYDIGIVLVTQDPDRNLFPKLTLNIKPVKECHDLLISQKDRHVWRCTLSFPRFTEAYTIIYSVNDKPYQFEIPALGEPIRNLFVSCNGFHEDPNVPVNQYLMWDHAMNRHREALSTGSGYHLILQGGDQVYADRIWNKIPFLKGLEAGDKSGINRHATVEFMEQVEEFYMNLYIDSWGGDHSLAQALATIPSTMMWDDHDIFDGWGSYDIELIECSLYQTMYITAEKYFCAFQLCATSEEAINKKLPSSLHGNHTGKTQVYKLDKLGIVSLDLRSERLVNRVCTEETYKRMENWLSLGNFEHVYLLLSIPIVYNDFDLLEAMISATGLGKELEDDLKDHWRTKDHREERLMLLKLLMELAEKGKYRITILSGDVHIGCAGVIYDSTKKKTSNATIINSLVSSAVVNVPPPPTVVQLLDLTGNEIETVEKTKESNIKAGLYRFHHDPRRNRYIGGRNYLEMIQNRVRGINCRWFSEGQRDPYELFIHPYTKKDKFNADHRLIRE